MEKRLCWLKRWIGQAVLVGAFGFTLDAGSSSGYLAWVPPSPLRFAPVRVPESLPPGFQEVRASLTDDRGSKAPTNGVSSTIRSNLAPDVVSDPGSNPVSDPTPAEQAVAPSSAVEEMVTGPEAMFGTPIPATAPVVLVTPQTLVELMRMHGTNAPFVTPSNVDVPVFIPPTPPASRATYHSAPASTP